MALTGLVMACQRDGGRDAARATVRDSVSTATPAAAPAGASRLQLAPGTFGFANADGSLLLALEAVANPAAMQGTLCPGAPARRVVTAGHQPQGTHDSGRQTAENFGENAGERFRVEGGPVPRNVSCYVTADSALLAGTLPFAPPPLAPPRKGIRAGAVAVPCDSAWAARVSDARGRAVVECWPMGGVPGGPDLMAVRFVTRDTNALASLVARDGGTLWFHDFPAVDHGQGQAVWRLDDGGKFPAAAMRIRFLSRVRGVLVVGMTWDGAEGENAYLLAADSSGAFRTLQHTYRYTAPM
jgi:hypothetical protein